ncbi:cyclopropane fatty acyl phospholipid synthase [Methanosarcina siciliae T4/M]|uniref:Cyclopropane fatty acyl phospholipid synthase n=2 Tax=Methanosarcina siciliae TaxID=38027 RepID=A0A0E3PEK2_9EURY|nr:cyclopropane-fatty-acyl-phospholipid synthase family protein [Methanosarcina siciliae]AKB29057.1 cyclopropane fatty acyl phospholipid synthase [Methanosarcina siciliae T4/M]AKB33037.1 cyclopropane fatty acyl phospholipid synthase [Methanosarcina siciliae HI350]
MMFTKSNKYDFDFVKENMMGPNAIKILEEVSESLKLEKGMRILDLGCGRGLTSIFLAKEYDVTVFATDLWISATDNYERIKSMGLEDKIIPIHAEAHDLPFANEFFDAAISIDAYHYFGVEKDYLTKYFAPLVKKGGQIAVAVPGLKQEFTNGVPVELVPYWFDDMTLTLHSCDWWYNLWKNSDLVSIKEFKELYCLKESWQDWLLCDNDYARRDIGMMEAEGGNYFNLISIIATKL